MLKWENYKSFKPIYFQKIRTNFDETLDETQSIDELMCATNIQSLEILKNLKYATKNSILVINTQDYTGD